MDRKYFVELALIIHSLYYMFDAKISPEVDEITAKRRFIYKLATMELSEIIVYISETLAGVKAELISTLYQKELIKFEE